MSWLVGALAAVGLALAASFTAAFYRPSSRLARVVPVEWCGLGMVNESAPASSTRPGHGYLEPPNPRSWAWCSTRTWLAAWATVAVGAYLGYRLVYVERMPCPVC